MNKFVEMQYKKEFEGYPQTNDPLSDDDLRDLLLAKELRHIKNLESSIADLKDDLHEIKKIMKFFYILGIISLVGSALYLIVTLAGLAG